jgi:DNA-binding CsgD family transcriptional regulator
MQEQIKSAEQLQQELLVLRRENKALMAQLTFHRRIFREVRHVLGAMPDLDAGQKDPALRLLIEESAHLQNELKMLRLSEREKEIFRLLMEGLTSKEMADRLGISKLTVDTHRKNLQQKLEISNPVELIKFGLGVSFG